MALIRLVSYSFEVLVIPDLAVSDVTSHLSLITSVYLIPLAAVMYLSSLPER
jgi:hypothetical protein